MFDSRTFTCSRMKKVCICLPLRKFIVVKWVMMTENVKLSHCVAFRKFKKKKNIQTCSLFRRFTAVKIENKIKYLFLIKLDKLANKALFMYCTVFFFFLNV